jgi:hypothetical protein
MTLDAKLKNANEKIIYCFLSWHAYEFTELVEGLHLGG